MNVDKLSVKTDFLGLLRKENSVTALELSSPYFLPEIDKKGKILFPLPKQEEKKRKGGDSGRGFLFKKIVLDKGALDYVDRKVEGPPAFIRLREIQLEVKNLSVTAENTGSDYEIAATLPGKTGNGSLKSRGSINVTSSRSQRLRASWQFRTRVLGITLWFLPDIVPNKILAILRLASALRLCHTAYR